MTSTVQPRGSHFIDGAYREGAGQEIASLYPATAEVIARVHAADAATVGEAVSAAVQAQRAWGRAGGTARGRVLRRAAELLRELIRHRMQPRSASDRRVDTAYDSS